MVELLFIAVANQTDTWYPTDNNKIQTIKSVYVVARVLDKKHTKSKIERDRSLKENIDGWISIEGRVRECSISSVQF